MTTSEYLRSRALAGQTPPALDPALRHEVYRLLLTVQHSLQDGISPPALAERDAGGQRQAAGVIAAIVRGGRSGSGTGGFAVVAIGDRIAAGLLDALGDAVFDALSAFTG